MCFGVGIATRDVIRMTIQKSSVPARSVYLIGAPAGQQHCRTGFRFVGDAQRSSGYSRMEESIGIFHGNRVAGRSGSQRAKVGFDKLLIRKENGKFDIESKNLLLST